MVALDCRYLHHVKTRFCKNVYFKVLKPSQRYEGPAIIRFFTFKNYVKVPNLVYFGSQSIASYNYYSTISINLQI